MPLKNLVISIATFSSFLPKISTIYSVRKSENKGPHISDVYVYDSLIQYIQSFTSVYILWIWVKYIFSSYINKTIFFK